MDIATLPSACHSSIKFGEVEVVTYYLSCLAQASYIVKCDKNAFIVDPRRDVQCYLDELVGYSILGTILTHLHADFVSGHKELLSLRGIPIYLGPGAKSRVAFPYKEVQDTESLQLTESYSIVCMHTPGHTKESSCFIITEKTNEISEPLAVFTGDTLFVKSVGRPDLVNEKDSTPEIMSQLMYNSIYNKLLTLPDDVIVYPAHGPGSPCGTSASAELHTMIGTQRRENPFLQFPGKPDEFVKFNCNRSLLNPAYFTTTVAQNISDGDLLKDSLTGLQQLEPVAFKEFLQQDNVSILDTRSNDEFGKQHIPNSIHFYLGGDGGATLRAVDGTFAMLVGNTLRTDETIAIVSEVGKEYEVLQRLCRIGYVAKASLKGGIEAWKSAGFPTVCSKEQKYIESDADLTKLRDEGYSFLDVRYPLEYNSNHCVFAENNNIPLHTIRDKVSILSKDTKYICYCKSGYRSSAATSILDKLGFDACDLYGGFAAISTYAPKLTTKGEPVKEFQEIMESLATLHA